MYFRYCILYIAAIGLLSQIIGPVLPRKWFKADRFPYRCYSWEKEGRIYRKLRVHKWKDRAPDMSKISRRMVRKNVKLSFTHSNVERLVAETCVAEMIHWVLIFLSPGIYQIWAEVEGFLIAVTYSLCNLPFIIIQRYNRPTLVKLAARLKDREMRSAAAN